MTDNRLSDAPLYDLFVLLGLLGLIFVPAAVVGELSPQVLWDRIPRAMFLLGWAIGILSYIWGERIMKRWFEDEVIRADTYLETLKYPLRSNQVSEKRD